jgi:hypothetical protein
VSKGTHVGYEEGGAVQYVKPCPNDSYCSDCEEVKGGRLTGTKPTNPKDAIGSTTKVPMSVLPAPVMMEVAVGMFEGGVKYGRYNYRGVGVRASVYYDATMRHMMDYWEGEDIDPDSTAKLNHISKAISSLVVMRDSMLRGNFVDDRPPSSKKGWMQELNSKIPIILAEHSDKSPRHYTIADNEELAQ